MTFSSRQPQSCDWGRYPLEIGCFPLPITSSHASCTALCFKSSFLCVAARIELGFFLTINPLKNTDHVHFRVTLDKEAFPEQASNKLVGMKKSRSRRTLCVFMVPGKGLAG